MRGWRFLGHCVSIEEGRGGGSWGAYPGERSGSVDRGSNGSRGGGGGGSRGGGGGEWGLV